MLTNEPMREDCPLRNVKNCTVTPHIAWAPKQTRERLLETVAENLKKWIEALRRTLSIENKIRT